MKISYVLQLQDFLIIFLIGSIVGLFYGLLNIINLVKKHIAIQILTDLTFSFICFFTFLISINKINMGEIRAFLFIGYILGVIIERITIGKLFAKAYKKVYNQFVKILKNIAKSKFGRILLK